jgi:short-chain fatty acids transporter
MGKATDGWMARAALRSAAWAERWFPDAWVFAALGVIVVAAAVLAFGATPAATVNAFGDGFWSLIPFTMQMAFVVIGGYVLASAPGVARFIDVLARVPRTGRGAICFVGLISMLASLLSWGFSLVFGGLLVRALARRESLPGQRPISGWGRCGQWDFLRRRRNCRPIPRACRQDCSPSPAYCLSARRFSCGNRCCSPWC